MSSEADNASEPAPTAEPADPGYSAVARYLLYSLSLPERALRSGSAVVAGAVRESAALLVPQAFQDSKTYSVMIKQMLDFMAEDIGGASRAPKAQTLLPPARHRPSRTSSLAKRSVTLSTWRTWRRFIFRRWCCWRRSATSPTVRRPTSPN